MPARIPLCQLPTPCHRLDRASEALGIDLWIKRDDLTGFAFGGNKGRKLEYLMAEAVAQRADAVVTCGASQSNFIRQLGAACSLLGMRCVAAVMDLPYSEVVGIPTLGVGGLDHALPQGNLILDNLLGVELHRFPDDDWEILYAHADRLADDLEAQGRRVYRIPIGGSSGLGAFAFVQAANEIESGFDFLVTPCSSGSTHAGLAYGFHGSSTNVIGIACDPEPEIMDDLLRIIGELNEITGDTKDVGLDFRLDWAGASYGVTSPESNSAIEWLARCEGIFLDPVYTAKAFAGLLDLARTKQIDGTVLFWHTGGLPALFAEHPGA